MAATALPGFLDALAALLTLRAGLAGVNVFTCPVDPADLGTEAIELAAETPVAQELAAMASRDIEEAFEVKGSIICYAPRPASASTVATVNAAAKTARDRACAILEELTDALAGDDTAGGSVRDAQISGLVMRQGMAPEGQLGRLCQIEFTISAEAHTTP
jgi:hypothetical protein